VAPGSEEYLAPGSEEYLNSEKYEIKSWDRSAGWSLRELIGRINQIRREHPALQRNDTLMFHPTDNPQLLCYSKTDPRSDDRIVCVVNLDTYFTQSGWTDLNLDALALDDQPFQVHDLIGETRAEWRGAGNFVQLDPHVLPAHVFAIRRYVRTEHDFDYFA